MCYKNYGGIDFFYDKDYELFIDCLEYAIQKENEVPTLINLIYSKLFNAEESSTINRKMRTAEEIKKDYGMR